MAAGPQSFAEANELHRRIGPEYWCVNKEDLKRLRSQVQEAIRTGKIVPTATDNFDPSDCVIGPSVYTVVEQYIQPVTRDAGGMSWALMLHPEGLKCDVFVTHAWAEGLFEFVDKVVRSFPWKTKNAWICFLANPQNLNIADLIKSPSESPFAKALCLASHVLVVPNGRISIYKRLWCAYEAFLACELNKVIQTAKPPILWNDWVYEIELVLGSLVLGAMAGLLCSDSTFSFLLAFHATALKCFMIVSTLNSWPAVWRVVNVVALACCANACVVTMRAIAQGHIHYTVCIAETVTKVWLKDLVMMLLFFLLAEYDRMRFVALRHQASQLDSDYSSVLEASCSNLEDESNIRAEVGPRIRQVDETVRVLIQAGMSTSSLRKAHALGVNMRGAAFIEYAFPFLMICASMGGLSTLHAMLTDGVVSSYDLLCMYVNFANKAFALSFFVHFASTTPDAQVFAYRVLQKGGLCIGVIPLMIQDVLVNLHIVPLCSSETTVWIAASLVWLTVTPFAVAGLHRVARIPFIGPLVANMLAIRGDFVSQHARTQRDHVDLFVCRQKHLDV